MSDFDIIGAGPAGLVLALLLAQRGHRLRVFERRADPRRDAPLGGRSINLALAARGSVALQAAGALAALRSHCVPMPGRMVHVDGESQFIAYGQRPGEELYSVARAELHRQLTALAAVQPAIALHFGQRCLGVQLHEAAPCTLLLRDEDSQADHAVQSQFVVAADGAGSAIRTQLHAQGRVSVREERLAHQYQEFTLPPRAGAWPLPPQALHIWPRGGFMLIALPNTDQSFTATLFLPERGATSFAALAEAPAPATRALFAREFADASELMPMLEREAVEHPPSPLGTVYCEPWHVQGRVLLLGDAAHAIVPFHGQGMNCALEDSLLLAHLVAEGRDLGETCARFEAQRRADTDAIAQMALENYVEMRDSVREPRWQRQKELALQLELRFPNRFIPRYSMVMFHADIGYAEALRRGAVQQQILEELLAMGAAGEPHGAAAARLVSERLSALGAPVS